MTTENDLINREPERVLQAKIVAEMTAGTTILPATGARRLQGEELAALKRRERTERARARFDR